MIKNTAFFLGMSLFTYGTVFGDINTIETLHNIPQAANLTEGAQLTIPDSEQQQWKLAFEEVAENGSWIIEWTPKNEEVTDWSKLIQIQFLPSSQFGGTTISAEDFSKAFLELLKQEFPAIAGTITAVGNNGTLIDWSLPKPAGNEKAQHELARIISTPQGIYRIAFTVKIPAMEKGLKDTWVDRLSKASIINTAVGKTK